MRVKGTPEKIVVPDLSGRAGGEVACFFCDQKVGTPHERFCVASAQFPVRITIRRVADGLERTYQDTEWEPETGWSPYLWEEGNFACDCNRALMFERAAGQARSLDDESSACGSEDYVVVSIVDLRDGEKIYGEDE